MIVKPPKTIEELMQRVDAIAGFSLQMIAEKHQLTVPDSLIHHKGWVGQLLEKELGASAGSRPEPDFTELGIELKTIPINHQFKPTETTYVCVAPLTNLQGLRWENSLVYHKLQHVLWLPIEASKEIPIAERCVGTGILWQPSQAQSQQLKQDWEEIIELIALGQVKQITARHGEVLQLRPKAAHSKVQVEAIGADGQFIQTNPRGFYLKSQFTQQILSDAFGIQY